MKHEPRYEKGDKIGGRYYVHQALMGGMGEVYLCLDEQENLPFALKTFQRKYDTPESQQIFDREVETWISLGKHENIVECLYLDHIRNQPFVVLEWVTSDFDKQTELNWWIRSNSVDLQVSLDFTIDICRGLQQAQGKIPGIVHRDLKPGNILVDQNRVAKITDFGLAIIIEKTDNSQKSDEKKSAGTPGYMSPEQIRGEQAIDIRSDIYAIGCIIYEMLTSKLLFVAETYTALSQQHLNTTPPHLPATLPNKLDTIVQRCLEKNKENRYPDIDSLLTDLTNLYDKLFSMSPRMESPAGQASAYDFSNRGMTYHYLGNLEKAIQNYDHAVELMPKFEKAFYNRAVAKVAIGDRQGALKDYSTSIDISPTIAQAFCNRGVLFFENRQYNLALKDYEQALTLDSRDSFTYLNRANVFYATGKFDEALSDFSKAIQLDPEYAVAYSNRGNVYTDLGEFENAIQDYQKAIQLNPKYAKPYYNLGSLLANGGLYEEALPYIVQAGELGISDAYPLIAKLQQAMANPENDLQQVVIKFLQSDSLNTVRKLVAQYPVLEQMVPTIQQTIDEQIPPEHRPAFTQRLNWLKQIISEGD